VQPDGSLLVRSESAESPYEAYTELFNQNLGIPFAAIRGFETLADTDADANRYRTPVATTSEKNAAIDASGLGAPSRAIAPQDITTPFTGAGGVNVQDLTFDERRALGEMPFGPFQITPARTITPTYTQLEATRNADLLRLDELESEMFARLARGASVPADLTAEINRLRAGQGYEEGSLAYGLFRDSDLEDPGDSGGSGDSDGPGDSGDPGPSDAIPANLPEFWRERYDEYLLLSPYLQRVILENQIKDYIELEPYRGEGINDGASIENLFTREPGSVADIALASVFDPSKGPVGGENFEVQPPAGFVPQSRIPGPLQLQGYANTGLQDILNIFYANPDRYISEIPLFEDIYDPVTGQVTGQRQVGTQQVLSPVAQAALQAFSTQRGAESADIASRFGTATPFGAIAGLGGTAEQAVGLAELQARAGVTNPYAALGTGSGIGDISQILRGGLTAEEQLSLAGLQARGGLSAQERLAEQRLAALSPLLQASPGTLGGLSRVLGGEEQLRGLFSPFGVGQASPVQGAPIQVPQQGPAPSLSSLSQQVSEVPFATQTPRQTLGGYQRADLFERGGIEAEAGMTGEELGRYLGQATPFGGGSPRGSLGAQLV
jgi:hypothetical protein